MKSMMRLIITWAVLLVLTTASLLASLLLEGTVELSVALAIGLVKAVLVIWVFMELKHEQPASRAAFVSAGLLAVILIGLVAIDVQVRSDNTPAVPASR